MPAKNYKYTLADRVFCNELLTINWRRVGVGELRSRRKWNWLGHTVRRIVESFTKQVLQRTPQGCRVQTDRVTEECLEKDLVEMWMAAFRYSWRKTDLAIKDRASSNNNNNNCLY